MPHMTIAERTEHECHICDFFQRCSAWCLRFKCVDYEADATKRERRLIKSGDKVSPFSTITKAEEANRLALHAQGLTDEEMASTLCIPLSTIAGWRRSRNLPVNRQKRYSLTKEERNRRFEVYNATSSDSEAASVLQISVGAFRKWRTNHGLLGKGNLHQ